MDLKKWIQRKVLDEMWIVMAHIDKDVIEEFTDNIAKQADRETHKCACHDENKEIRIEDHECTYMTAETLKRVEQEWIERGIIR